MTKVNDDSSDNSSQEHVDLIPIDTVSSDFSVMPSDTPSGSAMQHKELRRAPGRPRLLRTGTRGRPKRLYRYEGSTQETACERDLNEVDEEEAIESNDIFIGVAKVSIEEALDGEYAEE
jgi:hypothetical protein